MASFSLNGVTYLTDKINGVAQTDIVRILFPLSVTFFCYKRILFDAIRTEKKDPEDPNSPEVRIFEWEDAGPLLEKMSVLVSQIKREDIEHVMVTCMSNAKRSSNGGPYSPVMIDGIVMNHADDAFIVRIRLVIATLGDTIPDMFPMQFVNAMLANVGEVQSAN